MGVSSWEATPSAREALGPWRAPAGRQWIPFNVFAFDGEYKDKEFAEKIINETHEFWKSAISGGKDSKLSWKNTQQNGQESMISQEEAGKVVSGEPAFAVGEAISDMKAFRWEHVAKE